MFKPIKQGEVQIRTHQIIHSKSSLITVILLGLQRLMHYTFDECNHFMEADGIAYRYTMNSIITASEIHCAQHFPLIDFILMPKYI